MLYDFKLYYKSYSNSFFFNFILFFKLYIIVFVLPNIKMNPPQVYMCSPSWTLLPPPSPFHPSGSSQYTSPKHPVSCIEPGLATRFIHDILHVSMPFSQIFPPHERQGESTELTCALWSPFWQQLGSGLCSGEWENGSSGGDTSSRRSSSPGGGSSFLPLITPGLSHTPLFFPFCFFLRLLSSPYLIPCMEFPLPCWGSVFLTNSHWYGYIEILQQRAGS